LTSRDTSSPLDDFSVVFAKGDVGPQTAALLDAYGFDRVTFEQLRQRLLSTTTGRDTDPNSVNVVRGRIEPPTPEDLTQLPAPSSTAWKEAVARGEKVLRAGQVGVVILAGGMATRWGGCCKAAVEALPGQSFLALKVADVRRVAERLGVTIPIYIVVSFATHQAVAAAAKALATPQVPIEAIPQFISMRLFRDGSLVREADGQPSLYAPGHGDLPAALRRGGVLARFRAQGGRVLLMSNVDNLAATVDPAVIGAHLERRRPVTVEVVRAEAGDTGGAPARLNGALQIIEGFRFPSDFPAHTLPVFNTNTFVLDAEALDQEFPLSWFLVSKRVDGREVVQFERLVGEITAFLPSTYLIVPRSGIDGRFQPAKDPQELALARPTIEAILTRRGVLPL
jgi:UTP--glucose-1-phosphate uridylyltransferase